MTPQQTLAFNILPQPDDTSCGPTCLHAIYGYFGDSISLAQVIREVPCLESGGTLAVFLACHALARGYSARIFTYNLHVFDPSWFRGGQPVDLADRLCRQAEVKTDRKLWTATAGYLQFLRRGGSLHFEDLTLGLIRRFLKKNLPILTGLSSTYLYHAMREYGHDGISDDVRGEPAGHFVVLHGYDKVTRSVEVADPYGRNPVSGDNYYTVDIGRVLGAVLLGVLTHDANLLIIGPKRK
ncbi:MAG: hypothetical protein AB1568_03800 [Thermodesulfobacteriota bacterium]